MNCFNISLSMSEINLDRISPSLNFKNLSLWVFHEQEHYTVSKGPVIFLHNCIISTSPPIHNCHNNDSDYNFVFFYDSMSPVACPGTFTKPQAGNGIPDEDITMSQEGALKWQDVTTKWKSVL